jgi:hypothetical protein
MTVVKKGAVAVDGRIFPFVEHGGNRLLLSSGCSAAPSPFCTQ